MFSVSTMKRRPAQFSSWLKCSTYTLVYKIALNFCPKLHNRCLVSQKVAWLRSRPQHVSVQLISISLNLRGEKQIKSHRILFGKNNFKICWKKWAEMIKCQPFHLVRRYNWTLERKKVVYVELRERPRAGISDSWNFLSLPFLLMGNFSPSFTLTHTRTHTHLHARTHEHTRSLPLTPTRTHKPVLSSHPLNSTRKITINLEIC